MQRIMSKEPVIIPDGNGGIRERFLDREKEEAMARYAAQDLLVGLLSKPD